MRRRLRKPPPLERHPLEEELAALLLEHVCVHCAIDREEHARAVARIVLDALERAERERRKGLR